MPTMRLMESTNGDRAAGGVLLEYPGTGRPGVVLGWRSASPVRDPGAMARDLATRALDHLLRTGRIQDADATNWPSVVAGFGALVRTWNLDRAPLGGGSPAVGTGPHPPGGGELLAKH